MDDEAPAGLEAVFIANRDKLIRFLGVRGAGDAAEDLVQDLWLRVAASTTGPVAHPLAYLYRAAHSLMIDRHRSRRRTERRDGAWLGHETEPEGAVAAEPGGERLIGARQEVARVAAVLADLGPRRETVFRRFRIDGVAQRAIAQELGVSISTVENDLRVAYRALAELKETLR